MVQTHDQPTLWPDQPAPADTGPQHALNVARLIHAAARAGADPTADPPNIQSWFCLPTAAELWLPHLSHSAARLYVHLWGLSARFAAGRPNRWFYRTDRDLNPLSLSDSSLSRARAELRSAAIVYVSMPTPDHIPTHYALRWPLPYPPDANQNTLRVLARELQAGGEPWPAPQAWLSLCRYARLSPPVAIGHAQEVASALSPRRDHLLRASMSRLREVSPWLCHQLTWVLGPDDYRAISTSQPRVRYAQQPATSAPAIAQRSP